MRRVSNTILRQEVDASAGIRALFEQAIRFKSEGKNPIDLSIGSPSIPPPTGYYEALIQIAATLRDEQGNNPHGYMPNAGYLHVRGMVANYLSKHFNVQFDARGIVMTAGATNGLDIVIGNLIGTRNPGAEIILIAPYFPAYIGIVKANFGKPVIVYSGEDFSLPFEGIESAITPNTAAIIINSPNNPSARVYTAGELRTLSDILARKSEEISRAIVCIEDAPYSRILFPGHEYSSMLRFYPNTAHIDSLSKQLGIAGERIGFAALPCQFGADADDRQIFINGLTNRMIETVVNAPALQQRIIGELGLESCVPVEEYVARVQRLTESLRRAGMHYAEPQGGFFVFAEIPEQFCDEAEFRAWAWSGNEPLLYVPGVAFGSEYSGWIRLSGAASTETINCAGERLLELNQ
ncbi:aminotransferase class I/II-fold pyridoxal phosphate-dependent enzyme [Candidatus Woesearchaeota archaeon]|nr:aminotransferase class I/II-fold pyridoxal phosphate-dependent enzyme [Candidatus Woesearchaeota archaeon]